MEKKKTQRILGILVIIALVIILFPLLFGKSEPQTEKTSFKAPPFPEQQMASDNTQAEILEPVDTQILEPTPAQADISANSTNPLIPAETQNSTSLIATDKAASPATPVSTPTAADAGAPNSDTSNEFSNVNPANSNDESDALLPKHPGNNKTQSSVNTAKPSVEAIAPAKIADDTSEENAAPKAKTKVKYSRTITAQTSNKSWVIQMGSFKDKNNAFLLADKLRAAGYKAFTKDVKNDNGNTRTRVYIGPELKQNQATQLSAKIEKQMYLRGIVVPYQPLAL